MSLFDLSAEDVDLVLEALDALEREPGDSRRLSTLMEALLFGPPKSEDERLKRDFAASEAEREASRARRALQARTSLLRARLLCGEGVVK